MFLFFVVSVVTSHFEEALFLVERVVQFSEGVAQFKTSDIYFKAFHGQRIIGNGFCQWRNIARIVIEKRRLDQSWLKKFAEQEVDQLAACGMWIRELYSGVSLSWH